MTNHRLPFFVYGTLKPGGSNYRRLLIQRTINEQPAVLHGAVIFTEGLYPYLVMVGEQTYHHTHVHGCLLTIHPSYYEQTLTELDQLEQYAPNDPSSLYERTTCQIRSEHQIITAWVYVAGPPTIMAIQHRRMWKVPGGIWYH